ncbi:hypothetical protein [Chromobacterium violaceum]|nr:hypothetical protein [Chromobacterium violaceum]
MRAALHMVDAISHRYTYQEWITHEIARTLVEHGERAAPPA